MTMESEAGKDHMCWPCALAPHSMPHTYRYAAPSLISDALRSNKRTCRSALLCLQQSQRNAREWRQSAAATTAGGRYCFGRPRRACARYMSGAHDGDEGGVGEGDVAKADLLELLLALLLLLQQLLLARDVAPIALGQHILPNRREPLSDDDLGTDGRLDAQVKQLPRNVLLKSGNDGAGARKRVLFMHDGRQRIDAVAVEQRVHLDYGRRLPFAHLVVKGGIARGDGLDVVAEGRDDLG
mmetsp:Transcript_18479/g.31861  ORF Transcript_18479/g.31861 Transcript_18479/m.31861 type:complete len:240 (+) Transcript_18479:266-985(+)